MIKVHPDQIPESDTNSMVRSLNEIVKAYYENPDNMREFEEWKKSQKKQAAG